tara:strand:- start:2466 stop:2903 length:438 start_codon:yes stop_codon:yes gene_type:complete
MLNSRVQPKGDAINCGSMVLLNIKSYLETGYPWVGIGKTLEEGRLELALEMFHRTEHLFLDNILVPLRYKEACASKEAEDILMQRVFTLRKREIDEQIEKDRMKEEKRIEEEKRNEVERREKRGIEEERRKEERRKQTTRRKRRK